MTTEKRTEVFVGVIVTIAVMILILGIIWGKGMDIFSGRMGLHVRFDDVRGLKRGDPVLVRGVIKGEVERISLVSDFVDVHFWLNEDVTLFSDLQIAIENQELMGGEQLTVYPGHSGESADINRIFHGDSRADLVRLFNDIELMISKADSVLEKTNRFMEKDPLSGILENIEETTLLSSKILSENRRGLRMTVERLDKMTRVLERDSTTVRMSRFVTRLDSTVSMMKRVAMQMESEEGTIGKLLKDRWLYDQLLKTTSDLDSLLLDIKNNPKKYIHFSLF